MELLASIFGSKNVINKGMSAIDAMVFTDEEKVNAKMKLLDHYKPFKLAQRLLAFMYSFVFLTIYLTSVTLWIIGGVFVEDIDRSGYLMELAKELAVWNTTALGSIILLIIGFYFAGGVMDFKRGE